MGSLEKSRTGFSLSAFVSRGKNSKPDRLKPVLLNPTYPDPDPSSQHEVPAWFAAHRAR